MSADDRELKDVVDAAWVLGAVTRCLLAEDLGIGGGAAIDAAAREVMDAAGVRISTGRDRVILGRGLRSLLGQILMVADASTPPNWGDLDDATLVSQGRSSGGLWSILATADGPAPTGLLKRLGASDAVFLDVGTGVGGICVALCRAFPNLRCVGLDILPRALRLADTELTAAGVRHRVELREQDIQDLSDSEAFDVAWLPLPLLPEDVARTGISRVRRPLRTDGWLVVAANRLDPNPDPLQEALERLRALTVDGCRAPRDEVGAWLDAAGVVDVQEIPMPPEAPVIITGRRPRSE
jgi:precorrin-6B methylase 2